jgi:hypothetical protein
MAAVSKGLSQQTARMGKENCMQQEVVTFAE